MDQCNVSVVISMAGLPLSPRPPMTAGLFDQSPELLCAVLTCAKKTLLQSVESKETKTSVAERRRTMRHLASRLSFRGRGEHFEKQHKIQEAAPLQWKKRSKNSMAASSERPICSDCGQENCSSLLLLLSLKSIADKSGGVISIRSPFSPRRRRESLRWLPDTAERLVHRTFLNKCRRAADGQTDRTSVKSNKRANCFKSISAVLGRNKCICTVVFFFLIRAFRCRFSRCHQAAGGLQRLRAERSSFVQADTLKDTLKGDDAALQCRFGPARKRFHVLF